MDRGAWWVHRVAKSRTRLGDFTFTVPGLGGAVFPWGLSAGCSQGAAGAGVILNVASLAPPRVGAACRPG